MQDTALYQYLLGLQSPWTVSRVNLDLNSQRVDVWAEHPEDVTWVCPHCTKTLPLYDHAEERTWRHLDSRGGSGWLDSVAHSFSGAWRIADYAAVCRVVRLS